MNHAIRGRVLTRNPMRTWKGPKGTPRDFRVISAAEERRLYQAATEWSRAWITLALATGLRKGELRVLHASQIDTQRAALRLSQPKTGRGLGVIPLARPTMTLLRRLRGPQGKYLLEGEDGQPRDVEQINSSWRRTRAAAEVDGARFHHLRHTFATRLLERGASVPVVGELLGHAPPYVMSYQYAHPMPEAKKAAILSLTPPRFPHKKRGATRQILKK